MIYQGRTKDESGNNLAPQTTGNGTQLSKNETSLIIRDDGGYSYSAEFWNASYVGYWYTLDYQHGLDTPSSIYNVVNDFYSIITNSDKAFIDSNAGFCNDRSLASNNPYGTTNGFRPTEKNYYAAMERMFGVDGAIATGPTLKCKEQNTDLFTANGSLKGNKKLENPIGLLTIDEANYAGLPSFKKGSTTDNYIYTGKTYWTLSPFYIAYYESNRSMIGCNFAVNDDGTMEYWGISGVFGVRPVINLVKTITFSKGNGTSSSPFEI